MTLDSAPLHSFLTVTSFNSQGSQEISDIESRLMHLGFIFGARIKVTKKAPLFQEPLLVEVRGRHVALSQAEAKLVEVEITP